MAEDEDEDEWEEAAAAEAVAARVASDTARFLPETTPLLLAAAAKATEVFRHTSLHHLAHPDRAATPFAPLMYPHSPSRALTACGGRSLTPLTLPHNPPRPL